MSFNSWLTFTDTSAVVDSSLILAATDMQLAGDLDVSGNINCSGTINGGSSSSSLVPDSDNVYNIGSDSNRWANLFLGSDADISGNVNIIGTLDVSGSSTFSSTSNQLVLGATNTITISGSVPAASRIHTIYDPLGNSTFMLSTQSTVEQMTSDSTPVTIDAATGVITTFAQTLAAGATTSFTVNNSLVDTSSVINAMICSYPGAGIPYIYVTAINTGSFFIVIRNLDAVAALNTAMQISFIIC